MHKKKLTVTPAWVFQTDQGDWFEPVLFRLLESLRDSGKLTEAARAASISYRHAWNLLNRAADLFGLPLVAMQKGHGTKLTPLGEKLLWAEQRVRARLGPQIDSMASEFNDQIQQILAGAHRVLRMHASHGYAVSLLPEFSDSVEINLQYRNPEEALSALNRGDCDVSSFHFPNEPALAEQVLKHYQPHLRRNEFRLIRFVTRREGLMMRSDLMPRVESFKDLVDTQARYIGRDRQSGTRLLSNLLLAQAGYSEKSINRMPQQELTHTAVAAFVAAGMADVGFGVEAAARQFNLEFIHMVSEHYLLLCRKDRLQDPNLQHLIRLMRSEPFIERLHQVPGYAPDRPGDVITFDQLIAEDG
ncbi:substrate-binding domain-containing protein [Marinobacter sp. C2H3]|uniref:substrate-binding domain-containing protein n=1 Tax=Marinobacter sp. C2H3 TaxID=3119003 RepID=UPI00300F57D0